MSTREDGISTPVLVAWLAVGAIVLYKIMMPSASAATLPVPTVALPPGEKRQPSPLPDWQNGTAAVRSRVLSVLQRQLKSLGYPVVDISGRSDSATLNAITLYARANHLVTTETNNNSRVIAAVDAAFAARFPGVT